MSYMVRTLQALALAFSAIVIVSFVLGVVLP